MGRVAGVFDNPPGFPCTPPGVDILEGGKLTSHHFVRVLTSSLWAVSSLSVIRPITVVSSANLTMTFELCVAVQSCVYREYRSGLRSSLEEHQC